MKSKLVIAASVLMGMVGIGNLWCIFDPNAWIKNTGVGKPGLLGLLGDSWPWGIDGLLLVIGVVFLVIAAGALLIHPRIAARLPKRAIRPIRAIGWIGGVAVAMMMVGMLPLVLQAAMTHPLDGMVGGGFAGLAFCPVWFIALWQTRNPK
ncbi:MAG: hypothetical protein LBR20_08125 [Propionibacteriaceae bacterium]|jgi:hypothetical protein|nr:hypothetical protein [Propionibacteriaceae bacterium]